MTNANWHVTFRIGSGSCTALASLPCTSRHEALRRATQLALNPEPRRSRSSVIYQGTRRMYDVYWIDRESRVGCERHA